MHREAITAAGAEQRNEGGRRATRAKSNAHPVRHESERPFDRRLDARIFAPAGTAMPLMMRP